MSNFETKDLDARIRQRAVKELGIEVDRLMKPLRDIASNGSYCGTLLRTMDHDSSLSLVRVMDEVKASIVRHIGPRRADDAVAAFLDRVEALGDEIEDLRSQVGG
jgi:hypothetical protein